METELFDEMWNVEQQHWWFVGRRRVVASLVDRFAPKPAAGRLQVCELGCGTGGNLDYWKQTSEVCGMDISAKALEYARRRVGARVELGSLPHDVPFEPSSFDLVLMTDVFEHIEDDATSARAALSLLRPGGILVATVPAHQWLYSPRDTHHQHFRRYAKSSFTNLFQIPGAKIEYLGYYNSLLFAPAAAARITSKLFSQNSRPGDLQIPSGPLNRILAGIFSFERHLLGRVPMPMGLSLVTVVGRTGAALTVHTSSTAA